MNKLFTKIAALCLGATMAVGVGVAVGSNVKEATPVHAAQSTVSFAVKNWGGSTSSSYVGSATDGTGTHSSGTVAASMANFNPTSEQIRGNQTTSSNYLSGSNFYLRNTAALPDNIRGITMNVSAGSLVNTKVWAIVGSSAITSFSSSTSGATASTSGTNKVTWTFTGSNKYFAIGMEKGGTSGTTKVSTIEVLCGDASIPVTNLSISSEDVDIGGSGTNRTLSIGSSDTTPHTINVSLTPNNPTDPKVNIAHLSGTNGLFTKSVSQITCSNGSGSFTLKGEGATSGTETFRISANTETSKYVDLVVTALNDSATYYTVSFNSNGGSSSPSSQQVEDGHTFTFPSPGTKTHYSFDGWTSTGDEPYYAVGATSPAVTGNITYTAHWTENAKYTVTYVAGSSSYDHENQYSGSYTLLPFASTGLTVPDGYRFKDYTVNGEHKEAETSINLTGATTVTANFELMPRVDTLNRAFTGVADGATSYAGWSNKKGTSGAVYAGQSAGGNNSIQLRSTSPAGIITTTSGGIVRKVIVVWNSNTASGRTIDIYGKNTAYVESANLYASDAATKGTKLGSIVYGTSTELAVTGNYEYIGIRSNSSALYLSEIQIEWEAPNALSSVAVSFDNDPADRTFVAGNTFEFKGTLTASYTKEEDAEVTPASYHLNSETGTEITSETVLTIADHNGKLVYVVYTEEGVTKSDSFTLIVNYAPVTSVSISEHSARIGLNSPYDHTAIDVTISSQYADPGYEWSVVANTVEDDFVFDPEEGLLSGDTAGTITLRCSSTADSSKYDELVITVSANPTATFVDSSILGYVGKIATIEFTYGNIDDESLITVVSGNQSYFTVDDDSLVAMDGEGLVDINYIASGTTTIAIKYDGTQLASITVTVSADSVTALTWSAPTIKVYSGATTTVSDASSWNVHYTMASGDEDDLSYGEYTLKLGGSAITLPHTWDASEDGKVLSIEYGGFASPTTSTVDVTQSLRPVNAPVPGEESTKTWTATAAANFGSTIKNVNDTDSGSVTFNNGSTMSYERTLEYVASGKADYLAFSSNYIQFGSSNALEKLVLTAATSGTVTSVVVNCWAKDGGSNISVTVGGNAFDSSKACPSAGAEVTFNGSATGTVVITMEKSTKTAGLAQYIKSVAITTAEESGEKINIANVAGHEAAQKAVVAFAKAMNAAFDNTANCTDGVAAAWATASNAYSSNIANNASLNADEKAYAKNLIKYASAQYTEHTDNDYSYCLERAMATYEACIQKHGQEAFMSDVRSVSSSPRIASLSLINDNGNTVAIIVIISMISVTAIGGYFFLRKRKEN